MGRFGLFYARLLDRARWPRLHAAMTLKARKIVRVSACPRLIQQLLVKPPQRDQQAQQQQQQQQQQQEEEEALWRACEEMDPSGTSLREHGIFLAGPNSLVQQKKLPYVFPPVEGETRSHMMRGAYLMDLASVFCALALFRGGEESAAQTPPRRILDMCAAPGGKTLVIAEHMLGQLLAAGSARGGEEDVVFPELVANEVNAQRRKRLQRTLVDYMTPDLLHKLVTVTGMDAGASTTPRAELKASFDAALVDAPCGMERHILHTPQLLRSWSPSRSSDAVRKQKSILQCTWDMLRPGGTLVYSTCSISPLENDEVVQWALDTLPGAVQDNEFSSHDPVAQLASACGEDFASRGLVQTDAGFEIFPDTCDGFGPAFFSRLRKAP